MLFRSYDDIRYVRLYRRQFHHNDVNVIKEIIIKPDIFTCDIDPCDAFELIKLSGCKIDNDVHMLHEIHTDDIISFESDVKSYKRDQMLKELGIL